MAKWLFSLTFIFVDIKAVQWYNHIMTNGDIMMIPSDEWKAEAKHTPGPWEIGVYPPRGAQVEAFTREGDMAGNRTLRLLVQSDNIEADAYLIAAAPDMLTALTDLVTQARDYLLDPRRTLDIGQWRETIREADAAIAKAKGI